jgi:hypothetical protein
MHRLDCRCRRDVLMIVGGVLPAAVSMLAGGALSDREGDTGRTGAPAVYGGDRDGRRPLMPHLEDIQLEALLEAGYVVALVVVALGLEHMARIAHQRLERFETAGFRYHAVLDAWECPTGEHLALVGMNTDGRIARYRARLPAIGVLSSPTARTRTPGASWSVRSTPGHDRTSRAFIECWRSCSWPWRHSSLVPRPVG